MKTDIRRQEILSASGFTYLSYNKTYSDNSQGQ